VGGNVDKPGAPAPRRFPAVLSKSSDDVFRKGSGRQELSEKIFNDAAPLAARVHGQSRVGLAFRDRAGRHAKRFWSPGRSAKSSGSADDLAARFIAHSWSLKWLHRGNHVVSGISPIEPVAGSRRAIDPQNRLLSRMNTRRLDIEAFRDSILRAGGSLDETMYGPFSISTRPVTRGEPSTQR